ncbi:MAG: ferrous iron transport protein B [Coriobacteriia bacterium]|nr:ferrous iron transport protein B [Coriobacteriia bacterium]
MSGSCGESVSGPFARPSGDLVIAIAGNPNVGKSSLFNAFTGLGVETAHYPGTTQEVHVASARAGERTLGVVDLPGTYTLGGDSEEAVVARRALADLAPDVVVVVLDSLNLARTLYLALEILDREHRVVLAVNLADEARRTGIAVDVDGLGRTLGVLAVSTVATQGMGLKNVVEAAFASASHEAPSPVGYSADYEALIEPLSRECEDIVCRPLGLSARACALALLEGQAEVVAGVDEGVLARAASVEATIKSHFGESALLHLSRERHGAAGVIGEDVVSRVEPKGRLSRDAWSLTTWPWTGVPLAILVAGSIFAFLFFAGSILASAFSAVWGTYASPGITALIQAIAGEGTTARVLTWGFDAGIEAALSVGLPYILVFYVLLGLLEDSGYLNSLAFLTDRFMHRLGLHGRAVIPLVAGAGCSVPALLATRSLGTKRERLIASTLVMFVPCSARTSVILGAVGHYVGWQYTLLVMGLVFGMWLTIAFVLQRMIPGESGGLVMEMFPFRRPSLKRVLSKAWTQFREFLFVATPIVVIGSLVLGALYENGWLMNVSKPLDPIVGVWLGLPAVAGVTLLMGALRNELALQLLVVLAVSTAGYAGAQITDIMSGADLVVFALVNTIAFPCLSAVAVFWRRNGLPKTLAVMGASVSLALVIGGVVARVLPLLGLE